jgi:pimeloyl-ACP methyl ester carboxylesterase
MGDAVLASGLVAGGLLLIVGLSLLVEARRRRQAAPTSLYWDPSIAIHYATIDGVCIRHVQTGRGPNLLLLHTLRTQLDIYETLIPRLAADFTVHALDYPGHGWSDIADADYEPDLFVRAVESFLDQMQIEGATLAGVSIGGTISLLIAAKHNRRIKNVVAVNPYDYAKGLGITRGNLAARLVINLSRVPVIGETVMRLRTPTVERWVMQGGVVDPGVLSRAFLEQIWYAGMRRGFDRAFLNLVRHARLWEDAHGVYGNIRVPVLLVYGEHDWSRAQERRQTQQAIPGVKLETVAGGGHFLSLDQPDRLAELIRGFAR